MNKFNYSYCIGLIFLAVMASCQFDKKNKVKIHSQSKIVIDTIFSENLNENRLLSIYLPKGYMKSKIYPVVYSADGQIIVDSYKRTLDSLIDNKTIPEIIIIGVHSNETNVPNTEFAYRNYEYIKGWETEGDTILERRYENHYEFFTKEVIEYAERNYAVSSNKKDRIFYGTSNGAGLGVSIGAENPTLYSNYICFSMAGGNYENLNWTESNYPFYYLSYGEKEPFPLTIGIKEFEEFLIVNNYNHELTIYNGGHDRNIWRDEFFNVLPRILAKITVHNRIDG